MKHRIIRHAVVAIAVLPLLALTGCYPYYHYPYSYTDYPDEGYGHRSRHRHHDEYGDYYHGDRLRRGHDHDDDD